jgi:hypothetical protein
MRSLGCTPYKTEESEHMPDDPELVAMENVMEAVKDLDEETRKRVLSWAVNRFHVTPPKGVPGSPEEPTDGDFAELYNAANPTRDADRALVAGYWLQVIEKKKNFTSQQAHKLLKNLGHGVTNITDAFDALKGEKPRLAMQVRKAGTTRQARKQYQLTTEGIKRVKTMIG